MTTRNLPDSSEAARHGTGDDDLTIMLAAHAALRRDLALLARAAAPFGNAGSAGRHLPVLSLEAVAHAGFGEEVAGAGGLGF
jgi:hypothetical protein